MTLLQWLLVFILSVVATVTLWAIVAFTTAAGMAYEEWRKYPKGAPMRHHWFRDFWADLGLAVASAIACAALIWWAISIAVGEGW